MIQAQPFDDFVELHYQSVHWVCQRHTPSMDLAWEAFQETYVAFARRSGTFEQDADVGPWLREAARRCSLAVTRRGRRHVSIDDHSEIDPSVEMNVIDVSEEKEAIEIVRQELGLLSPEDRHVLELAYYHSKTQREIAREMDCPPGSVFSKVDGARDRLRQRVKKRGIAFALLLMLLRHDNAAFAAEVTLPSRTTTKMAAGKKKTALLAGVGTLTFGAVASSILWASTVWITSTPFPTGLTAIPAEELSVPDEQTQLTNTDAFHAVSGQGTGGTLLQQSGSYQGSDCSIGS